MRKQKIIKNFTQVVLLLVRNSVIFQVNYLATN